MSQLAKLKPQLLRAAAQASSASTTAQRWHTQRHSGSHTQRQFTSVATPAAASHSSSSSSSSALPSFSFTSRILMAMAGVGSAVALTSTVLAEPAAEAAADSESAPKQRGGKKKKKLGVRKALPNPGKYANIGRAVAGMNTVHVSPGLRAQFQFSAFPHESASPDKVFVLVPIIEMGGQQGTVGMLNIITELGEKHHLEALVDSNGGVGGSWEYNADNGLQVHPSFQFSQHGNQFKTEFTLKKKEWTGGVTINPQGELHTQFARNITPSITAGAELHYAFFTFAHLNGLIKWEGLERKEQLLLKKEDNKYSANWMYELSRQKHSLSDYGFPDVSSHVGLEYNFNSANKKSDVSAALRHERDTYVYHSMLNSAGQLLVSLDSQIASPSFRFGANAIVDYGNNHEAQFGLSVQISQ